MGKSYIVGSVVIVIIIAVVAIVAERGKSSTSSEATPTPTASVAATASPVSDATSAAVEIKNFAFSPATITVKKGTTVTWTNQDSMNHTVTSDAGIIGGPNSQQFGQGQTYSFTFSDLGTYSYSCQIHPKMTGTVVVIE